MENPVKRPLRELFVERHDGRPLVPHASQLDVATALGDHGKIKLSDQNRKKLFFV